MQATRSSADILKLLQSGQATNVMTGRSGKRPQITSIKQVIECKPSYKKVAKLFQRLIDADEKALDEKETRETHA